MNNNSELLSDQDSKNCCYGFASGSGVVSSGERTAEATNFKCILRIRDLRRHEGSTVTKVDEVH